jgi:DNA primase
MKKDKNWVDYKTIKEQVTIEIVLKKYGFFDELKKTGPNIVGCCPIHKGTNPRQFSVNLEKSIWKCFGNCQAGGNVLDFVARMEGVEIREAALLLKDWFGIESEPEPEGEGDRPALADREENKEEKLVREEKQARQSYQHKQGGQGTGELVNPPLKFRLKSLEPEHIWFEEKGIEPATVKHFGLGFCTKGMMRGRIAIPIHNERGELVAYCGRAVSQEQIKEGGKYKLPANFHKSAVVYNLNRLEQGRPARPACAAKAGGGLLVLVESFLSVWWLYQAGIEDGLSTHLTPWDRGAMLGACMCVVATFPCPFWIEYEKRFVKNRIYRGANCRGESVSVLGGDLRAAGCRT